MESDQKKAPGEQQEGAGCWQEEQVAIAADAVVVAAAAVVVEEATLSFGQANLATMGSLTAASVAQVRDPPSPRQPYSARQTPTAATELPVHACPRTSDPPPVEADAHAAGEAEETGLADEAKACSYGAEVGIAAGRRGAAEAAQTEAGPSNSERVAAALLG
jgi:hypothetical protein